MMRPISVSSPPTAPVLSWTARAHDNNRRDNLTWTSTLQERDRLRDPASCLAVRPMGGRETILTRWLPTRCTYSLQSWHQQRLLLSESSRSTTVGYSATAGYSTLTTWAARTSSVPVATPVDGAAGGPDQHDGNRSDRTAGPVELDG